MRLRTKILSALAASTLLFGLLSCTGGDITKEDVTASCKLNRTPTASKTFDANGIEEAEIVSYVDGDTTTVRTVNSGVTYKIRYLGIDTPESTIGYDKWGKAASVYNKKTLSKATSIVIEAEKNTPEKDSSGSRYLAYVWYKTEGSDTYRNFNLELVENGYSANNTDPDTKYYEYFEKASKKAQKLQLHIWGNDEDIYYSEDIHPVTLKDLKEKASDYYNKETEIPVCVSFDAYVVKMDSSSARTITVEQYNPEDGQYYQYDVFVGYEGPRLYKIAITGSYLHFVGWPTGEGSIHGCVASLGDDEGLYSYRYSQKYYKLLADAVITAATLNDGVTTFTVTAAERTYTLTYTDSTLTSQEVQNLVSATKHTIKCFIPNNDADDTATTGFINTLSDIK